MISTLNHLKEQIEELKRRFDAKVENISRTIEETKNDAQSIPKHRENIQKTLHNIKTDNKNQETEIENRKQQIEQLENEIISEEEKRENLLERLTAIQEEIETYTKTIADYKGQNIRLEERVQELKNIVAQKKNEWNKLEENAQEEISADENEVTKYKEKINVAKDENKLIVYLMESGLLDVPEAEIVSTIAAYPEGLTISEIKEKVNLPPVRVQPTLNNLLDEVIRYDEVKEKYIIIETIQSEF